jgi:polyhydroxyalkanoate synthesis regulator protein
MMTKIQELNRIIKIIETDKEIYQEQNRQYRKLLENLLQSFVKLKKHGMAKREYEETVEEVEELLEKFFCGVETIGGIQE